MRGWKNKTLEEKWEDDSPVHVTWLDYILNILIILCVIGIMWFASFVIADASNGVNAPVAGVNRHLMLIFQNGMKEGERLAKEREEEKQKVEEEKAALEAAKKERLISLFGSDPSSTDIDIGKRVVMAEAGNTEPMEGLVACFYAIANRTKRHGNFGGYYFPDTVSEVAIQPGQMDTYANGNIWRYTVNDRVEEAWEIFLSGQWDWKFKDIVYCWSTSPNRYFKYLGEDYHIGNHHFGGLK